MKTRCAILGSGHIGTDLLIKILRHSEVLEVVAFVGVDAASEGLAFAQRQGIFTTAEGLAGLMASSQFSDIAIVFDATSAKAHVEHAAVLAKHGKRVIDLTPAAVGPYVVPVVNGEAHLDAVNVNMTTCGGQATIPIVHALSQVGALAYAEIVASIASKSAGPGTRANIDEFTMTTSRAIEQVGGAARGKAIIVLNPADPPVLMRDTVYAFMPGAPTPERVEAIRAAVQKRVEEVRAYVPGYRLKQEPVVDAYRFAPPGEPAQEGTKVTVFLEVEGAGHHLPKYAGNLDIMTSAARRVGELMARRMTA